MNKPQYIIVHTVARKGITTLEEITDWHVRLRKFRTIGYHYYIRKDGLIEAGREENEQGAHCLDRGMNTKSIGICMEGHGDYEPLTPKQLDMLIHLCIIIMHKYRVPISNILGHRETGAPKSCPGKLVDMTLIRNLVEAEFVRHNTNT